ncbi:hypothetical protein [Marinicrinis sediminis]|uniref:YcxB family protein n=1 Tax=Marinicrinis sediminis TaxID=1652465 RepID=A0ABW5RD85_9BACL
MSRKWKRMIDKNSSQLNQQRKKKGQPELSSGPVSYQLYKGRSLILPSFLMLIGILFFFTYSQAGNQDTLYWFTVGMYVLLAIYYYFRRPYLKIMKNELATRKLGREVYLKPAEIQSIAYDGKGIAISLQNKRTKWMFSKGLNRYPVDAMATSLKEFALKNGITYSNKHEG